MFSLQSRGSALCLCVSSRASSTASITHKFLITSLKTSQMSEKESNASFSMMAALTTPHGTHCALLCLDTPLLRPWVFWHSDSQELSIIIRWWSQNWLNRSRNGLPARLTSILLRIWWALWRERWKYGWPNGWPSVQKELNEPRSYIKGTSLEFGTLFLRKRWKTSTTACPAGAKKSLKEKANLWKIDVGNDFPDEWCPCDVKIPCCPFLVTVTARDQNWSPLIQRYYR